MSPVAVVIDGFGSGGTQRVAASLVGRWAAAGRPVHLITFHGPEADFFPVPAGVRRTVVGGIGASPNAFAGAGANLCRMRSLRRALRAHRGQAVLSFLTSTNVLVVLASVGLDLWVVISERNDPVRQDPGRPWRVLRRLCYRLADVVTANSTHAVEVMADYVPRRRLAMVPNPIELPEDCAAPGAARLLLNVGRLVPQKGQAAIVSAFARLAGAHPDWRLAILGDGLERADLEHRIASNALGTRVALPGTVPDPENWYRDAGAFVLASAYEGTPNALLEAMAHGLPCIVPDCLPGALEHVTHDVSGVVYRAGDMDDLTRCLARLMGDAALRDRLGRAARERIAALSSDSVSAAWDRLLFPEPARSGPCSGAAGIL